MRSNNCPIPNTHRRLEHAHRLWHQALDGYDDPDGFQANLNAAIEALRNVTFMLQGEKSQVPGFEKWYEQCRATMKADPVLAWLHDARTTVVHKADLETTSTASATIHTNLTLATVTVALPPLMPTFLAAASLSVDLPEPFASNRRDLVMSVERRWSTLGLPGWELLDALAHAYGVLSAIVATAHQRAGRSFETRDHQGGVHKGPGGRLPCMITTTELRTVRVALKDGRPLIPGRRTLTLDDADIPQLERRYGPRPAPIPKHADPIQFAEAMVPIAKKVLQADRYHIWLMYIRTPLGWTLRGIDAADRPEKYAILRRLANEVKKLQGDAIVEIAEAWMAPLANFRAGRLPEEAEERKEVLVVSAATADGRFRSYDTVFKRDSYGDIVLEETEVRETPVPTYLAPFCEIWGLPNPGSVDGGGA